MRLHHLAITAFGPFPETVEVDFDALADAGLFLLTGPTGGGKTSVLDAVCFALYGDVPGDRSTAKRLRSDLAAPGAAPEVSLEVTLSGRRFRLVRSPSWARPKRRGTGTTHQQASVTMTELVDDDWRPVSSRLDETGHLVTELVGMNLTQFVQVAMLPQGQFQAFLRASSEDRQKLLQQLFRTGRFELVEGWLRERRLGLRRVSLEHQQRVTHLVSRLSESSSTAPPADWDDADPALLAAAGEVTEWADAVVATAAAALGEATTTEADRRQVAQRARDQLAAGRTLLELQTRHHRALTTHQHLSRLADSHAADVRRLDAARRASPVAPLHDLWTSARRSAEAATTLAETAVSAAATALGVDEAGLSPAALGAARDQALRAEATTAALLPRETALADLHRCLATDRATLAELGAREAAIAAQLESVPAELERARALRSAAVVEAASLESAESAAEGLTQALAAAADVTVLSAGLEESRDLLREVVDRAQRLREAWLDLHEQRLTGMAAEIALGLAVGACCPVCGSAEHPRPATAGEGAPDAAAEKAVRRAVDDVEAERQARSEHVRDLETRLAVAAQRSGGKTVDELTSALAAAQARLAAARTATATLPSLAERVAALTARAADLTAERDEVRLQRASLTASFESHAAEAEALAAQIAAVLEAHDAPDLATLCARLAALAHSANEAVEAQSAAEAADRAVAVAESRLAAVVEQSGFVTAAEALAAILSPDALRTLGARVTIHQADLAAAQRVLDDPDLQEASQSPAPDLAALEAAETEAADGHAEAQADLARARGCDRRVRALTADLHGALGDWAPVRDQHETLVGLASLCEGKSLDNRLQMRLSAYVLAWRLTQVVAAANQRLAGMSDHRYSLEHTSQRGAGESRGGLSLMVLDDWSGEQRDPATLSGGETFVVSLALALGLADVITQEAGGADLDTLFVDEGFGSLDPDTLDDVMDTLDSLRDGGRVVGVVSHVPEMRDRIPAQLAVRKGRSGSTLELLAR